MPQSCDQDKEKGQNRKLAVFQVNVRQLSKS